MMTIGEFRAFLEGMDIGDAPTPAQWARIKEKLDALFPSTQIIPTIFTPGYNPHYPDSVTVPGVFPPFTTCDYSGGTNGTRVYDPATGRDLGPSD